MKLSARAPLAWILLACAVIRVIGIGWGLPASDGWDNDGIAPRDFLPGLIETLTPGHHYTYPPLQLLILAVVTLPVTAAALLHAPSLAPPDVIAEILNVSYMTWIAYIARAVSLGMSLGITYALAKIGETIRGPRAGLCVAAVCGADMTLTYYAHTTNLDVPYLFWASLSLLELTRTIAWHEPRRLRKTLVLATLAVATKDQAYALFLVSLPLCAAMWFAFAPRARRDARAIGRELLRAVGAAVAVFLVVDAVIVNPTGFLARLRFLVGPASQDFATYTNDMAGRWRVIQDVVRHYAAVWPTAFLVLAAGGLFSCFWRARARSLVLDRDDGGARWIAAFLPLFAAISFTLTFNCIARRVEHRFILPQSLLLSVYAGLAVHALLFELRGKIVRLVARGAVAGVFAQGLFVALTIDANLLLDPRYDVERWMREHFAPGDRVETYGLNVYLPRFPENVHVARIGPEPPERRNPMPGFEEVQDRFDNLAQRKPRWVVVCEAWAWRYLASLPKDVDAGLATPPTQFSTLSDQVSGRYFHELVQGRRGYRVAHFSAFKSDVWPVVYIHGTTSRVVWIMQIAQE